MVKIIITKLYFHHGMKIIKHQENHSQPGGCSICSGNSVAYMQKPGGGEFPGRNEDRKGGELETIEFFDGQIVMS